MQTTLDDFRSTEEDALRRLNSAPLPTLSTIQRTALVQVREAVARAQAAAMAGDLAMADAATADARQAAQTAATDGSSLPPGVGVPGPLPSALSDPAQPDPNALAQFGAYLRALLPKTGLATPLAPNERQLATDLLTSVAFSGTFPEGGTISFTVSRDGRHLSDLRILTPNPPGPPCVYYADAFDSSQLAITNKTFTVTYTGDTLAKGFPLHFHDVLTGTFTSPQQAQGTLQVMYSVPAVGVDCTRTAAFTATAVATLSTAPQGRTTSSGLARR